jgi:hypothetical protein
MTHETVPTRPSLEELKAWEEAVEREIVRLLSAIAPLQRDLDGARARLDLIKRLRQLGTGDKGQPGASDASAVAAKVVGQRASSGAQGEIEPVVEEILGCAGAPMHVRSIWQALVDRRVPLPGRGDEANIILRLRRDSDRFVRTGRGMYGLKAWNLPVVPPATRRVRRSRSRR